jgi:arylsulfatase
LSDSKTELYGADEYISGEMLNGKWVRKGDFKAMSVAPPYGPGEWQLYNVAEDPGETRDLAKEMPELLKELRGEWDDYAKDVGVVLSK